MIGSGPRVGLSLKSAFAPGCHLGPLSHLKNYGTIDVSYKLIWHEGHSKRSQTKFSFKLLKKCSFNNFLKMGLLAAVLISSSGNSHQCLGNSDRGNLVNVASLTNGIWSWALFLRLAKSALFLLPSFVGYTWLKEIGRKLLI